MTNDGRLNWMDPSYIADPYAALAAARAAAPVQSDLLFGGWLVLSHKGMAELLRDPSYARDPARAIDGPFTQWLRRSREGRRPSMLFMDDPDHHRIRSLVNKAFTPRAVAALAPRVQQVTDELLDVVDSAQPFDLMTALAVPLPITVIAEMIGVDPADGDDFKRWSEDAALSFDPFQPPEVVARIERSIEEFGAYFGSVIAQRRRSARSDLTSALVAAQGEDGARLSDEELLGVLAALLVAGNITTTDMIGNGTLAFLQHRDQWHLLCERPELAEQAVEEVLRYDTPVMTTARIATSDVQVGGCPVAAGEWVSPSLAAANRDPAAFDDPDRFDIERTGPAHVSFGGGPHFCLGAPLARLEGRIAFATLARRFPSLRLANPDEVPPRRPVPGFRGLRELVVVQSKDETQPNRTKEERR